MSYNLTFIQNATASGIINGVQSNVSLFLPFVLLFEWFLITMAGTYANSRKTGYSNFFQWGALAGIVTTTSAFFIQGTLDSINSASFVYTVSTCVGITIILALMALVFDDN